MAGRQRLDHIDAMRPLKQMGVVSTHTVVAFTPVGALVFSNATLLLLHVSREAFFAISACMLTYAYSSLKRDAMKKFYWRRFVAVGIPYLVWNLIYFVWYIYPLHQNSYDSAGSVFFHFVRQLEVGYDQLYFLIVIAEFYVAFPLVLWVLRKTRGHHALLLGAALVLQVFFTVGIHWGLFGYRVGEYAQQIAPFYVLYLVGGAVVACHLSAFHDWVMSHAWLIVFLTVAAAIAAEAVYFLTKGVGSTALGDAADPFQPSVIPFNVGVICCGYLAGMWLVRPERRQWIRKATRIGSDDSYGIFLAQMLFITALALWGGRDFAKALPFYVWIPLSIAFAYFGSIVLTELLARTPLAMPVAGRKQIPWRAPRPAASAQTGSVQAESAQAESGARQAGSRQTGARQGGARQGGARRAGSHRKVATGAVPAGAVPAGAAVPALSAPVGADLTRAPAPAPAARDRESTTLAATACDQNGA
jgi:peptidoglycan/LPS O-acetylase OafA/YrhL